MTDDLFLDYKEKLSVPLYKYYGNLDYARDVIDKHRIHFELPENYNDIYDSAAYLSDEDIEKAFTSGDVFIKALSIFMSNEENKTILKKKISPELRGKKQISTKEVVDIAITHLKKMQRKDVLDGLRKALALERIVVPSSQRISCFSENKDSLLMWAYYANCHKGLCLEFDLKSESTLANHCHKVQYTKHFNVGNFTYTYYTKSIEWSHEQEWRIVLFGPEYVETNSLKSVYLGYKIDDKQKLEFIELCKEHKLNLFQVKPSVIEYKLEFEQLLCAGESVSDN